MRRSNRELWYALFAVTVITALYALVTGLFGGIPGASGFFGHMIGVLGFILMLMTETLYSLRKRSRRAHWGKTSDWLSFHIFTGIVGPYMVLLHTSWRFNGLAGATMLLTLLIVLSGFIGRYIYTRVPRSADGLEMDASTAAVARRYLAVWHSIHIPLGMALFVAAFIHALAAFYYATLLR